MIEQPLGKRLLLVLQEELPVTIFARSPPLMPTLILTPRQTEDSQALWRAAGRLGGP